MSSIFLKSRVPVGILCLIIGVFVFGSAVSLLAFPKNPDNGREVYIIILVMGLITSIGAILFLLNRKIGWILLFMFLMYGTLTAILFLPNLKLRVYPIAIFLIVLTLYSFITVVSSPIRNFYTIKKKNIIQGIVLFFAIIGIQFAIDFVKLFSM